MSKINLSELMNGINVKNEFEDVLINDIKNNSRLVERDDIYVAIKGINTDGHIYAQSAIENGAAAVVVEKDLGIEKQIIVDDTKKAYALMCANYFGNPAKKLKLIGVTGTNGKTSVTSIVHQVCQAMEIKAGLIGTIQIEYCGMVEENKNTTPDAYVYHQTLSKMQMAGCEYVISEVSSHALVQERVYGSNYFAAAFTNLSRDHLDYHSDMQDYFNAKKKLFAMCENAIVNVNNEYGVALKKELCKNENINTYTFGTDKDDVNFNATNIINSPHGVEFRVEFNDISGKVHFAIPGDYSVENAMTAVALCSVMGISMDKIISGLSTVKGVKGRSEVIYKNNDFSIICDYAHTPDGIENVLSSINKYVKGRLIALFGCGGDRDKTKRPMMAKACEKFADLIIVTSDNPRSEDPDMIIDDTIKGFEALTEYEVIADRTKAIEYAIKNAKKDDIIVLLGKGHETYQILKDKTIHYDEREIVAQIIDDLKII